MADHDLKSEEKDDVPPIKADNGTFYLLYKKNQGEKYYAKLKGGWIHTRKDGLELLKVEFSKPDNGSTNNNNKYYIKNENGKYLNYWWQWGHHYVGVGSNKNTTWKIEYPDGKENMEKIWLHCQGKTSGYMGSNKHEDDVELFDRRGLASPWYYEEIKPWEVMPGKFYYLYHIQNGKKMYAYYNTENKRFGTQANSKKAAFKLDKCNDDEYLLSRVGRNPVFRLEDKDKKPIIWEIKYPTTNDSEFAIKGKEKFWLRCKVTKGYWCFLGTEQELSSTKSHPWYFEAKK